MITIRVFGEPQPMAKKQINRWTGAVYARDPNGEKLGWMDAVRNTAAQGLGVIARPAAISMRMVFYRTKPKSVKLSLPTTKPDLDNYAYAVTNALIGVAYEDDSQICVQRIEKRWVTGAEQPGVHITIENISGGSDEPRAK